MVVVSAVSARVPSVAILLTSLCSSSAYSYLMPSRLLVRDSDDGPVNSIMIGRLQYLVNMGMPPMRTTILSFSSLLVYTRPSLISLRK